MIADYAAFVVPEKSTYRSWKEVISDFKKNPKSVKIAGGSVKGSMDHLVPAMAIDADGTMYGDPEKLRQVIINLLSNALDALLESQTRRPRIEIEAGWRSLLQEARGLLLQLLGTLCVSQRPAKGALPDPSPD